MKQIKQSISIPIIVKLGKNFTNPIPLINQLYAHGVAGVVLFNRMVTPDIQLDKMSYTAGEVFSHHSDLYESLRWVGLASDRVPKLAYAASGGIVDGTSLVKAILASYGKPLQRKWQFPYLTERELPLDRVFTGRREKCLP